MTADLRRLVSAARHGCGTTASRSGSPARGAHLRGEACSPGRTSPTSRPGGGVAREGAGDAGSVTAELAVGLPAVVLLLVVVLVVVGAGLTRAQCLDGARAGARALALGESPVDAAATARRVAGSGARVRAAVDGEWATVVVEAPVPVGGLRIGPLTARGEATARVEP